MEIKDMIVTLRAKWKTVFLDLEDRKISCKSQLTLSSCMAWGSFLSLSSFIFEGEGGRKSPGPCWTWLSDDFINVLKAGGSQTVIDYFNIVFEKNQTIDLRVCRSLQTRLSFPFRSFAPMCSLGYQECYQHPRYSHSVIGTTAHGHVHFWLQPSLPSESRSGHLFPELHLSLRVPSYHSNSWLLQPLLSAWGTQQFFWRLIQRLHHISSVNTSFSFAHFQSPTMSS